MLSFEAYKRRLETGLPFIEFNYQLLQSYDFLQLYRNFGCRLQIGGDDQWGNIVAGMELIRRTGEEAGQAFGLTFPLIETACGKKMGKTEQGAIFLDTALTSAWDFFQYWRNVADTDLRRFLLMFTFLPLVECERLAALPNPNEAKERLAWELTALIHGKESADRALSGAKAAFGGSGDREALPTKKLDRAKLDGGYNIVELLCDCALCPSRSEARRLVEQGGAFIQKDGEFVPAGDIGAKVDAAALDGRGCLVIRAGKKRCCRLVF